MYHIYRLLCFEFIFLSSLLLQGLLTVLCVEVLMNLLDIFFVYELNNFFLYKLSFLFSEGMKEIIIKFT